MADKRTAPGETARRGKRAAPTIDLTATEVTPQPKPESRTAQAAAAPQQPEPPPVPPQADKENKNSNAAAAPVVEPTRASGGILRSLVAGAAGAAATMIVLLALWFAGFGRGEQTAPAAAIDTKTVDGLTRRLGKIEETLGKLPPSDASLADRVAAADNTMKALGLALAALNKHSDDIAATASQARDRADAAEKAVADLRATVSDAAKTTNPTISPSELDEVQKRLSAVEQTTQSIHDDVSKTASADKAMRLALSAVVLRDAVESGAPFAAEFAQAQFLSGNDRILTPIAEFAAKGLPSSQALAQDLRDMLTALTTASDVQPSGNFFERLQANAGKLVRVRPVDAPTGDDATAVLARLEIDAAKSDLAAALADLGKLNALPEPARARAQQWTEQVKARDAALAATRQFASETTRSLGPR